MASDSLACQCSSPVSRLETKHYADFFALKCHFQTNHTKFINISITAFLVFITHLSHTVIQPDCSHFIESRKQGIYFVHRNDKLTFPINSYQNLSTKKGQQSISNQKVVLSAFQPQLHVNLSTPTLFGLYTQTDLNIHCTQC